MRKKNITVKANKKGRHISRLLNLVRIIVLPIYYILKPFRFYGNRKVGDGAYIYVSNHFTMCDPVYPAVTTWEGIHFVTKKEAFKFPVIGWVLKGIKAISVNRDGNDARGLLDCFKCLKNGEKICIYPEGTRNKKGKGMLPFRSGAATISIKTKTPIIPVVMYKKPRFFRCAHILIGEPFEFFEYYDKKMSEDELKQADEKLRQRMLNMIDEHTQFLASKRKKA